MRCKRIDEIEIYKGHDGKLVVFDEFDKEDHYPVLYYEDKKKGISIRLGWFDPEEIGKFLVKAKKKVIDRYLEFHDGKKIEAGDAM